MKLIDRDKAIQAIQEKAKIPSVAANLDTVNGLCGAVAILYDLPSVTPQEPILDKIRAEIKNITPKAHIRTGKLSIDTELMIPLNRVLIVLDKYKAESERT